MIEIFNDLRRRVLLERYDGIATLERYVRGAQNLFTLAGPESLDAHEIMQLMQPWMPAARIEIIRLSSLPEADSYEASRILGQKVGLVQYTHLIPRIHNRLFGECVLTDRNAQMLSNLPFMSFFTGMAQRAYSALQDTDAFKGSSLATQHFADVAQHFLGCLFGMTPFMDPDKYLEISMNCIPVGVRQDATLVLLCH